MIKKIFKKTVAILCIIAIVFLLSSLFLSLFGEEKDCEYLVSKEFAVLQSDYTAAVYYFRSGEFIFGGLTITKTENVGGKVLMFPSFPLISGEKDAVEFGWEKMVAMIIATGLLLCAVIKRKGRYYEPEEEELPEDTEEENPEQDNRCPNCGERVFGGNEYCENCGVNIEAFRKKQKR